MVRIYLITGFLGSGKTTFLKQVLTNSQEKVGVLVNEFGKISIDGPILQKAHMNLVELNNGSIFCSCIKEYFIQSLKDLITQDLDAIFIESSGLADPSNMLQIVDLISKEIPTPFDYVGSICIIDGLHFEQELKKMVSVERQIVHSQIILINKVDLIDATQLEKTHQKIRELNPEVTILDMSFGQMDFGALRFAPKLKSSEMTTNKEENRPYVIVMRLKQESPLVQIQGMVSQLKDHCHRIKGIIRNGSSLYTIDTVLETLDVQPYTSPNAEEQVLVFISSIGVKAVSLIIQAANTWIPDSYVLES